MSLILDALNRSDTERSGPADTPGLHSVHGPRGDPSPPLWRRFLWPGLALAFAVIAGLAWWGSDPEPEAPPELAAEPPAVPAPAPASVATPVEVRPAPVEQSRPEPRREIARESMATLSRPAPGFSDDVAALYSQMQEAGVDPDELVEAPAPEPEPARPSSQMAAQSLAELERMAMAAESDSPEPAAEAPTAPEPQSNAYDVDALARAAQAELDNRPRRSDPLVQHEAPFISDLRQSQKDQIPSIFYSQHNWTSDPSGRSVVLNGEERREGQQVKPGLRLVEILETSIVLNFNGTEFQLRSLNSWVNL